jgi:hypothetical protein
MNNMKIDSRLQTYDHKQDVCKYISIIVKLLLDRSVEHDNSKLEDPEKSILDKVVPLLESLKFGSPEYIKTIEPLKEMSQHHYANNKHHIQHWENGIKDMDLVDICEMICDWKAATKRGKDGNIKDSLEIARERYNLPEELICILRNTVERYF